MKGSGDCLEPVISIKSKPKSPHSTIKKKAVRVYVFVEMKAH